MKSDPEAILCNSVKMIREKLSVSTHGAGTEHREKEDDYVYDLYYQETATPGWIQDILSVRPYTEEGELVSEGGREGVLMDTFWHGGTGTGVASE